MDIILLVKICTLSFVITVTASATNDIGRFFTSTNRDTSLFGQNGGTQSPNNQPLPRNDIPSTRNVVPTFSGLASNLLLNAVLGNQGNQQQNPLINQLSLCPVEVPFCFRTKCQADNPLAESNANDCYRDITCCFDQELYQYRKVYGSTYLRGVPVCFHGPTSSGFRQIARSMWPQSTNFSPFTQSLVVKFYERTINSSGYLDVALSQCSLTNLIAVRGPKCGWKTITKSECRMRDCCYDDISKSCHYPRNFNQQQSDQTFYPELYANTPEETQCSNAPTFNRIPCIADELSNDTVTNKVAKCHFLGCCVDLSYFIPETFIAVSRSGGGPVIPSQLQPESPTTSLRSGSTLNTILNLLRSSGSQIPLGGASTPIVSPFTCPYNTVSLPSMPDLTPKAEGCCERHWCYQAKRLRPTQPPPPVHFTNQEIPTLRPFNPITPDPVTQSPTTAAVNPILQPLPISPNSNPDPESLLTSELLSFVTARNSSVQFPLLPFLPDKQPPLPPVTTTPVTNTPSDVLFGPENSAWGPWGSWESCSASCGQGNRLRYRECLLQQSLLRNSQLLSNCEGDHLEIEPCSGNSCVSKKIAWTSWNEWSTCSSKCGDGVQKRKRDCVYEYNVVDGFICRGNEDEERSCTGKLCSHWGHWSEYGGCRAECGSAGNQILHRVCLHNENPVEPEQCMGRSSKLETCYRNDCIFLTEWGFWESCSFTCGTGIQKRRRICIKNGVKADPQVCNGTWVETQPCRRGSCPGQTSLTWATWESWSNWGECSTTCGSGKMQRTRNCVFRGTNKIPLPNGVCEEIFIGAMTTQSSICNGQECPDLGDFYAWTTWSEYSPCSNTCGRGTRKRKRFCFGQSGLTNSGRCPGLRMEETPCGSDDQACVSWMRWTDWSSCNASCGRGSSVRMRCRSGGDSVCLNNTLVYEEKDCSLTTCP